MVTREFFRRWGEYRQLIRELKSYSDVELAELGMVRSACARTAFDAAFGSPLGGLRRWLRSAGARSARENHSSSAGSASAGPYL
jgi:uncharacterized protein YjiS (DUF1127 family)